MHRPFPICDLNDIIIPENRIRRNITEASIRDLAEDIAKNGLYHAVVLRHADTQQDRLAAKKVLLAGERRLSALRILFKEERSFEYSGVLMLWRKREVPFSFLSQLQPSDALEVELHENLMRTDLDWQAVVGARAKLHELRLAEAEKKDESWLVSDTAKELAETSSMHPEAARRAVERANIIAPHLDDPLLKNVKSEKEAHKLLLRQIEGEFFEALKNSSVDKAVKHHLSSPVLHKGDFQNLHQKGEIPHSMFDLIITDPPYGIGADNFGDAAKVSHNYSDNAESAIALAANIFKYGYEWTREDAHLFMFCDIDNFGELKIEARQHNWSVFRTPLVWIHSTQGHIPWGVDSFRREYDFILYAKKGDARLIRTHSDFITISKERGAAADSGHGARKPPRLYGFLMSLTCLPGSYVIDPCCGSGPIFPAARAERMVAWGIEKDPDIYKSALVELERSRE